MIGIRHFFQRQTETPAATFVFFAILAALIGVMIGTTGVVGALLVAALVFLAAILIWPELGFALVLGLIVLGQLVRIPIPGTQAEALPNDFFLPLLIVAWLLKRLLARRISYPRTSIWIPLAFVILVMAGSIFLNRGWYDVGELMAGSLYAVRWVEYAFLFLIAADYARDRRWAYRIILGLIMTGLVLAVLGFVQLRLVPDFSFMAPNGWDPHIGRLLSTWFDPNFLAGYLAAIAGITLSIALLRGRRGPWWWVATSVLVAAIILTYSRSGYLALVASFGIVTIIRSRALLYLGILVFAATIIFVPRVQERVLGIRSIDETAQLRIVSWQNALSVIETSPIVGVGYNFYREAQDRQGLLEDADAHSATGADSSLLFITATMGIAGLVAYGWLLLAIGWEVLRTARMSDLSPEWRAIGLGAVAAMVALFVHSQFVNGLLYPHLMQFIWTLTGVLVAVRTENRA